MGMVFVSKEELPREISHGSLEMTNIIAEPFPPLSSRGARQGDVAISS